MGPKSFSAVMARKTTSCAEWKIHQNQYISGASGGGLFQVVEVVQKQRYFKFVISPSYCQQLGLYSKCYTVCDFTLHWSHSKCPDIKTAKLLLSVLRTGKPKKTGAACNYSDGRTERWLTCNCSLFHFATFVARFHQSFDCHSKITATEHFWAFPSSPFLI